MYLNLEEATHLKFSNCQGCQQSCCDGSRFILAPIVLDDFQYIYKKFLITFAVIDGRLRMVMILSNGFSPCLYYKEGACTIYDERPPACVLYPYTPYDDEVLIDTTCDAIGEIGSEVNVGGTKLLDQVDPSFYHPRLEGFSQKLDESEAFLESLNWEFRPILQLGDIMLQAYTGNQQNSFIQMHKASLEFLNELRG